jgi:UDP-glucose 4-epimerase
MKNKKVAVTGGLGFIGSHLIGKLNEDNDVVIIDNQASGNIKNIEDLDFTKIDTDFSDITQANLELIFEDVDYVFHMAAVTSVPLSVNDPIKSNEVNITGTLKVLEAAKNCEVKKLILSSSSAVYGETETVPINEKSPINPLSPYAVTKATGELYCRVYSEIYELSTIALRYFNVFGPKQDPKSQYAAVIPIFIDKLLKNESPLIYGDGKQTRDFVSIKQVVEANILAAKSNKTGSYNIGLGKSTSINQLFEMIKDIMGKDISPIYENERAGEIKHSVADISKAKSIGYTPKNEFKEELAETVEWFSSKLKS